ncbi:MAG TPA: helix-turn-helix domain-containing protein, partial [Solirubrobacteraceae bacterium]
HVDSAAAMCPRYHHAVELIGRRWSGAILRALLEDHHRYADVKAFIPGLSDTMLAQRLRQLEREGLVIRHVAPTAPVRVSYALTPKGEALAPVIEALTVWAHEWVPMDDADARSAA